MRLISDDALGFVTVYMEAEGEPFEGKVAVAEVILRRKRKGTVASVVLKPKQFSGWNTESASRVRAVEIDTNDPVVHDCIRAWSEALAGSNHSNGATHYLNEALVIKLSGRLPDWVGKMTKVAEIGDHSFYL